MRVPEIGEVLGDVEVAVVRPASVYVIVGEEDVLPVVAAQVAPHGRPTLSRCWGRGRRW